IEAASGFTITLVLVSALLARLQESVKRPVSHLPAQMGAVVDRTPKMEPDIDARVADLVGHRLKAVVAAHAARRTRRRGRGERNVIAVKTGEDPGGRTAEHRVRRRVFRMKRSGA